VKKRDVQLNKDGQSYGQIGRLLGLPRSTVSSIIRKYITSGTTESGKRSGRPKKLSDAAERRIVRVARQNPRVTAKEIQGELQEAGVEIRHRTVQLYMTRNGLRGYKPRKRP
jgi:transposase